MADNVIEDLLFQMLPYSISKFRMSPEAVAGSIFSYRKGILNGIMSTAPELIEDLANQIDQSPCDPKSNDNQLVAMAQVIQTMPDKLLTKKETE